MRVEFGEVDVLDCHENATNKTKTCFIYLHFWAKCDMASSHEFHLVERSSLTSDSPERKQAGNS